MPYPIPSDESKRLAALRRCEILDTPAEVAFDRITSLAAEILGVPAVLVSLVDDTRQWFKSNIGIGAPETPRDVAFCAHTIMSNTAMVVPDAARDARFANNPLVTGSPHIRFYAGAPIRTSDGFNLGTLCAIDFEPKQLTPEQISILEALAAVVMDEIELRLARLRATRQVAESKKAAVIASRARAEAEIWLEEAIESIADGFALFDGNDRLITSNRIYREMHARNGQGIAPGMSYEDILRNAAFSGCFADAADDVEEWVRGRIQERRRGAGPAQQRLTDGRWLRSADYRTNSGITVMLLTDITELKKREAALRETTEKLQVITKVMTAYIESGDWKAASGMLLRDALQLLESRFGFIGIVAPGPALRVFNHEGMEWHKTENRDFYEQALTDYKKHGYLEFKNFNNLFGRVITTGEPVISNQPYLDGRSGGIPPGHPRLDAFLGVPMRLGSEVIGMIGVANRSGGYGPAEQDRLQVIANFVAVLYDNFRQIERRQKLEADLHHADKIQAVGQLTGGVAHDFNNLLTVILGQLELLEASNELTPAGRNSAAAAIRAGVRGAELTHRLLAFSRKQVLSPVVTDINELISGMIEILKRTLGAEISIETNLAPNLWPAMVDQNQVENALLNLAINARDAMPKGGKLIVETANMCFADGNGSGSVADLRGDYVKMTVADTGSGIPPDVLSRVFEPFFTTKEPGKGTGLGLSMVYGFVKQSGGHVEIASKVGSGTTITIFLPRSTKTHREEAVRKDETSALRGNETILVVEDDPNVRSFVVAALHKLGYQTIEAESGPGALALLAQSSCIDLVLTDMVLPSGLSGLDVVDELRRRCPGVRVLFTSGYAPATLGSDPRLDPRIPFLAKPYRLAELGAKIREALTVSSY